MSQPSNKQRLTGRECWIVAVSSMEQIIGAGLSTLIGVMLPMMQMVMHPGLSSVMQGLIGAMGLIGIAFGSMIIGKLSDREGYLKWFRISPLLIIAGALVCLFFPNTGCLIGGLFLSGFGVGGGYSLDSAYISELMPPRWRQRMVGVAKATSAIGFIAVAALCGVILRFVPNPHIWPRLMLIIAGLGVLTLLLRVHWAESPGWLVARGEKEKALKAMNLFYGKDAQLPCADTPPAPAEKSPALIEMFRGINLQRVIYSGIPWACEGLAVYGFGVFLPILVMALGIESAGASGIHRIIESVEVTVLVNFFILPGFVIGLLVMHRLNHAKMMAWGFIFSAIGLATLYAGYAAGWPKWVMIGGFIIFEMALNAGPHLITYIVPSAIYPVADRGTGTGIAAMTGKIGAIVGVIIMPILLEAGGAKLVLIVSGAVMLAGAAITIIYGHRLGLLRGKHS